MVVDVLAYVVARLLLVAVLMCAGATGLPAGAGRAPSHLIASGLSGEPVPPVMLSGAAVKKNS